MSLLRLAYYSAIIGGWAAFIGWLIAEFAVIQSGVAGEGNFQVVLVTGVVGAAIGAGLNVVAGLANAQWKRLLMRSIPGILGGGIGGAIGGLLGNLLYTLGMPRALGFMVLGIGVGIVDGVFEGSTKKIRNGLIGGGLGGLIGGLLFDPISSVIASDSGMSSRAAAFVILGVSTGALIGLTHLVLREAWLTVLDGYGPGRQLILSQTETVLGRADHLRLPFIGPNNAQLESEHVKIVRQSDGSYTAEDNNSQLGTTINQRKLQQPQTLDDGDVIKFGTNFVRFNQRTGKQSGDVPAAVTSSPAKSTGPIAPPPPPTKKVSSATASTHQSDERAPARSASSPGKPAASPQKPPARATGIRPPPPPPKKKKK